MAALHRFLSRRWLVALFGGAALLFGLAMLHPYPRQSLFGPTIRGKPWCYWEGEVRQYANPQLNLDQKIKKSLGLPHHRKRTVWPDEVLNHEEMLPLLLKLSKDDDKGTRGVATRAILTYESLWQEPALPLIRQQLGGTEPLRQIHAAKAIWRIAKDKEVFPIVFQLLNQPKPLPNTNPATAEVIRRMALSVLSEISRERPEFFADVVAFANDANPGMRVTVMKEMGQFGNDGVPVLMKGLDDSDDWARLEAVRSLWKLRASEKETVATLQRLVRSPDRDILPFACDLLGELATKARAAISDLERLVDHGDRETRNKAIDALVKIDPERRDHYWSLRKDD